MTQDEIIAMANTAAVQHGHTYEPEPADGTVEFLTSFAALVAAKEREACAQVCESTVWTASIPEWRDMTKHDIAVKSMLACAAAIRARGTKEGV